MKDKHVTENILVVDDDISMCLFLKEILQSKYKVTVAHNGMEALERLSNGKIPDLIISDLSMPLIDGLELLEIIRTGGLYKHIPVIILSSSEDSSLHKRSLELGAGACLNKPFDVQILFQEIDKLFVSKMFL